MKKAKESKGVGNAGGRGRWGWGCTAMSVSFSQWIHLQSLDLMALELANLKRSGQFGCQLIFGAICYSWKGGGGRWAWLFKKKLRLKTVNGQQQQQQKREWAVGRGGGGWEWGADSSAELPPPLQDEHLLLLFYFGKFALSTAAIFVLNGNTHRHIQTHRGRHRQICILDRRGKCLEQAREANRGRQGEALFSGLCFT